MENTHQKITNLALRRSIFFPASEIYNGPAGLYDYGPYGEAIRRRIIELWRQEFVQKEGFLEIFGCQLMPAAVFQASNHLTSLVDPISECTKCRSIFRVDKFLEEILKKPFPEALSEKEFDRIISENKIKCPKCRGELSSVKKFNMLVQANLGVKKETEGYLRPETCQSIFLDFDRLAKTMRVKLPFGVSQVGTVFRNEISPRQGLLRMVEFSQMETEVFFNPEKIDEIEDFDQVKDCKIRVLLLKEKKEKEVSIQELVEKKIVSGKIIAYYLAKLEQLYQKYGFKKEKLRFREVGKEERPFYAKETWDFEVLTSLGWLELVANNYRTDYDLKGHMIGSKKDLTIKEGDKKIIPHVFEISIGLDRTFYAILENSYQEEKGRVYLSLNPRLAPLDLAVFPLLSNREELVKKAKEVEKQLRQCYRVFYDETGSIGKRYARMDEIGVPFCLTIDFESLESEEVTIRERDSTKQLRVKIKDLNKKIFELIYSGKGFG